MTTSEQIITLAKRYCLEQYDKGLSTQQRIAIGLLNGVEYLTGKSYKNYETLKTDIVDIGIKNLNEVTSAYRKKGHLEKIETEKGNFIEFVNQIDINNLKEVESIPFKRRLSNKESELIKQSLKQKWDFDGWNSGNYYWEPLAKTKAEKTVFFDTSFLNEKDFQSIAKILASIENETIYHITEDKIDFEIEPILFNEDYLESAFSDKNHNWIIYFSHEGTVAFGGQKLIKEIELELAEKAKLKNTWKKNIC